MFTLCVHTAWNIVRVGQWSVSCTLVGLPTWRVLFIDQSEVEAWMMESRGHSRSRACPSHACLGTVPNLNTRPVSSDVVCRPSSDNFMGEGEITPTPGFQVGLECAMGQHQFAAARGAGYGRTSVRCSRAALPPLRLWANSSSPQSGLAHHFNGTIPAGFYPGQLV